jgi:hypothetical protein
MHLILALQPHYSSNLITIAPFVSYFWHMFHMFHHLLLTMITPPSQMFPTTFNVTIHIKPTELKEALE